MCKTRIPIRDPGIRKTAVFPNEFGLVFDVYFEVNFRA